MLVVRVIFLLELLLEFPGGSGRGIMCAECRGVMVVSFYNVGL